MFVTWFGCLEDYERQLACAKQIFYSALQQSSSNGTMYLSASTIELIEEELTYHEEFLRMLYLLKIHNLEHLVNYAKHEIR